MGVTVDSGSWRGVLWTSGDLRHASGTPRPTTADRSPEVGPTDGPPGRPSLAPIQAVETILLSMMLGDVKHIFEKNDDCVPTTVKTLFLSTVTPEIPLSGRPHPTPGCQIVRQPRWHLLDRNWWRSEWSGKFVHCIWKPRRANDSCDNATADNTEVYDTGSVMVSTAIQRWYTRV
ncbi:hypothetical protein J6590_029958 [Homalodisca vitripennis]|nr:hypothetical protein J6590_029958 [Homalodisca vitripennis]